MLYKVAMLVGQVLLVAAFWFGVFWLSQISDSLDNINSVVGVACPRLTPDISNGIELNGATPALH